MKKFYLAALVLAATMVNTQANAQQGFSVSVRTTPHVGLFWQEGVAQ